MNSNRKTVYTTYEWMDNKQKGKERYDMNKQKRKEKYEYI